MQTETGWLYVVVAVVAAAAGWLLATWRSRAASAALVASSKAQADVEIATTRERLRAVEGQSELAAERLQVTETESRRLRDELDRASNDMARLDERASRVAGIEMELQRSRQQCQQAEAAEADLRASTTGEIERLSAELTSQTDRAAGLLAERDTARAAQLVAEREIGDLRAHNGRLTSALEAANESIARLNGEQGRMRNELAALRGDRERTAEELTDLRARAEKDREGLEQQLQLLMDAKATLTEHFKGLASDILEDKAKRFTEQNQVNLSSLLDPLRLKIGEFQGKVEEVYVQESKDRSALQEQVRNLVSLNKALSDDAKNLTLALKGSAKAQGGWGEMILERVLELSGLRKGIEYVAQHSEKRDDGTRAVPDVVIHLPEERRLVVDAKVSLVAYDRYVAAADDSERAVAIRTHLDSVRNHLRSLSEKQYQALYGIKSLDFVLAFVPIEPAFMLAVTNDGNLFQEAWDRNVLLVSPSTLLFVVRTVAHLWRQEAQTRNAQEIAKRGAELYDKLSGFVSDLQLVGARLTQAREAYDAAESKLVNGRGNVIRQAEMLRALGVKPTKALPVSLLQVCEGDPSTEEATALVDTP